MNWLAGRLDDPAVTSRLKSIERKKWPRLGLLLPEIAVENIDHIIRRVSLKFRLTGKNGGQLLGVFAFAIHHQEMIQRVPPGRLAPDKTKAKIPAQLVQTGIVRFGIRG